ncbi:MAG: hypothetical protein ACLQAT_29155 [Candidatus Binataceae bacterium]
MKLVEFVSKEKRVLVNPDLVTFLSIYSGDQTATDIHFSDSSIITVDKGIEEVRKALLEGN